MRRRTIVKPTMLRTLGGLALVVALVVPALAGQAAALGTTAGAGGFSGGQEAAAQRLRGLPSGEDAQPAPGIHLQAVPADPLVSQQWALTKANLPHAWDITTGSSNVTIAIVDTGVDLGHSDLQSKLVPGRNTVT